jgi:uncharacterized protein YcbK (DUF882 family)
MVIKDGKKIEINIGGISKSTLENLLEEQQKNILEAISKASGKTTIIERQVGDSKSIEDNTEREIKENSLSKIADVMSNGGESSTSNLDKRKNNTTTTKKDVSKTLDLLKDID